VSWGKILLLAGVAFGVVVVLGSRFTEATVSIGAEGPTVTPSANSSGAGTP
jgi:hypothetical protein